MADRMFTLKKWQQIKRDIFDDFFTQNDLKGDVQELIKAQLLGEPEVPEGSHRMPDGSIMLDSEMPGFEGGL